MKVYNYIIYEEFDYENISKKFEYRKTQNIHDTYDMRESTGKTGAIQIVLAMFLPILLFVSSAVYSLVNNWNIFIIVALIFYGILVSMIALTTSIIYNKEHDIGNVDSYEIQRTKEIRSIIIVMSTCITFIPKG